MGKVLVLIDHEEINRFISGIISEMGHEVRDIRNISSGIELIQNKNVKQSDFFDLIILPDQLKSSSILPSFGNRHFPQIIIDYMHDWEDPPELIVVGIGYKSNKKTTYIFNKDSFDFINMPIKIYPETSLGLRHRVVTSINRAFALMDGSKNIKPCPVLNNFIGHKWRARRIKFNLDRVSLNHAPVLINSEPGVEVKGVVTAIHLSSLKREKELFELDCTQVEYFDAALLDLKTIVGGDHGFFGSIWLHEVSKIPMEQQIAFISTIDDYINSPEWARLIFTSSYNLQALIEKGRFREELLHKISEFEIDLPPLRERKSEILKLIEYLLKVFCEEFKLPKIQISKDALDILTEYPWPGNDYELASVIRSMVYDSREKTILQPDNLPLKIISHFEPPPPKFTHLSQESKKEDLKKPIYRFYKSGSYWKIGVGNIERDFSKKLIGLKYMHFLLHHPNKAFSSDDLYNDRYKVPETSFSMAQITDEEWLTDSSFTRYISPNSNQPQLKTTLMRLEDEIQSLDPTQNMVEIIDKRNEKEKIAKMLKTKLPDRDRCRIKVLKAINRALKEFIDFPEISKVLKKSNFKTGYKVMYHPEIPMPDWDLTGYSH
jgi:DNA-binding NtrC family response regulator